MNIQLGQFSLLLPSQHYRALEFTLRTVATTHGEMSLLGRQNPMGFLCYLLDHS